tara:strand:+ start:63 stop:179 length:117 start_codon:yes stop_codon:yes gene_type:complete
VLKLLNITRERPGKKPGETRKRPGKGQGEARERPGKKT